MIDEKLKYRAKLTKKLDTFSGRYMSNTKWSKLFKVLSQNHELIGKCLIKDVWDNVLREIRIPRIDGYSVVFNEKGINDTMTGGPTSFKEIQWIEFPSKWTVNRPMGQQILESFTYYQDISEISNKIAGIGELEIELSPEKLIVYGYK
ncbi:hypothetical protein [Pontibacter pamirensis]|uniref:hypothetical protein n=1 Tax=Pontibacter pamirensis TaxID=2562824 RepID=UPI001389930D|nr:hypothetical protein [Pontibacter pamirensis]